MHWHAARPAPPQAQNKTKSTDGAERYTAPSLIFETPDGRRLEAGGYQPLEVYDAMLANLEPGLTRRPPAATALEAVREFEHGLVTREVALIMAGHNQAPDDDAAARELIQHTADGDLGCVPIGNDALWFPAAGGPPERLQAVRELVATS